MTVTENGHATAPGPVAGLRVLDFTHVFAGPFCTRTLADLGADVVHVETHARGGEDGRRSAYAHRSKRSIALDLKKPAGQATAVRLAAIADVIVENFSSGVMKRLGVGYDDLSPANPRLIYVSMSGYGHTGPRAAWTSMNMNLQAYTGLMLTTGAEGDPPTAISNSWNDYIGGLHAVIAILHALEERHGTGRGRNIDLSQFECSVATLGPLLMAAAATGQPPKRWGNRSSSNAPQGVYPCAGKDEWCAISVETNEQWQALTIATDQPDLARDPRFATTLGRMHNHDTLDQAIATWTRELPTEEVERRLKAVGVPAERMRRADTVVNAPDTGAVYQPVPNQKGAHPVLAATVPFTLSASAIMPIGPTMPLGGATREVLREWLSLDETEIDDLDRQAALT
jgi:benzylsuccinate CoA-transferase BbsF subunit